MSTTEARAKAIGDLTGNLSTGEIKALMRLIRLMADEADEWLYTISDSYRPLMCEPRTTHANRGARCKLSLGDFRYARFVRAKIGAPK